MSCPGKNSLISCPSPPHDRELPDDIPSILKTMALSLSEAGFSDPYCEARYILSSVLGLDKFSELHLAARSGRRLDQDELRLASYALARRSSSKEPLQYIFGKAYFRNLVLDLGPGVLIPRPETEELTDLALARLSPGMRVCEIGTGSGAIALSIASEMPGLEVFAGEKSRDAIAYARKNRDKLGLDSVKLFVADMFESLNPEACAFDLIAANLPYVNSFDYANLDRDVRDFEPRTSLESGIDGLDAIRRFLLDAWRHLKADSAAILEISPEQEPSIVEFAGQIGRYSELAFEKDLCGKTRFCIVRTP